MSDSRPTNCRFRLKEEGKAYPRSSCQGCGNGIMTGLGKSCSYTQQEPPVAPTELDAAVALALEGAKPVAWKYRWKIDGEYVGWRYSDASNAHPSLDGFEEMPLYDAAAMIQPHQADALDRVRREAHNAAIEAAKKVAETMGHKYFREQYEVKYNRKRYDIVAVMRMENKVADVVSEDTAARIRALALPVDGGAKG